MYQNKLKCQTGHTGEASHSFIHSVILWELSTLQLKWHLPAKKKKEREKITFLQSKNSPQPSHSHVWQGELFLKLDKTLPNNNQKHLKMTVVCDFFYFLFKKCSIGFQSETRSNWKWWRGQLQLWVGSKQYKPPDPRRMNMMDYYREPSNHL